MTVVHHRNAEVSQTGDEMPSLTEAPDSFPGYYTMHIMKDGTTSGMRSVNAYTSQVWYHAWHGTFVAPVESARARP